MLWFDPRGNRVLQFTARTLGFQAYFKPGIFGSSTVASLSKSAITDERWASKLARHTCMFTSKGTEAPARSRSPAHAKYRYTEEEPWSRSKYSRSMSDSMRFLRSGGFRGNLSCWKSSDMSSA